MIGFYTVLIEQGFVNRTAPTPDEWDHPAGLQVRIRHVSGVCEIRYRRTPPESESKGIDKQIEHDRSFEWNLLQRPHGELIGPFVGWLMLSAGTIAHQVSALDAVA